ncbi:MAG: ABC transporter ATP-binding protein [Candidatus Woesearchaeota archaeon]|jgi:putative ABC transport system ATP-binding protein|nr:ABC transporter ATP-binding protein [Candidatus Woesearchaeota archaeon]MDP7198215.1 ABC transporter ATP-binding protein [Candidatus Woesearchaeota archaeon]MDP7467051.1 ABC transporter ATP-binding protein [Candidatus Woesearchaeota archaeon]MDP7646719.1 ABC transporter ATP-binding protein [Candidatus Woesearchaeota archaeon]
MNILELKKVWKTYTMGDNKVHALQGISLQIKPKDFVAILGPSGSGKSTAMNIVGCLDLPTQGTVLLDGKDISKMSEDELARARGKKIGFVFQKFNLIATLSALQNVMLPMLFQGTTEEARIKRATQLLKQVGLGDRIHHKPTELSGGQQQRVAISRALVNDPSIILADEPTGNLDSVTGHQVVDTLKKLNKQGKTVIMVTHEPKLAKHAKSQIRIEDGKIAKRR